MTEGVTGPGGRQTMAAETNQLVRWVEEFLFAERGTRTYAILDGASVPDLRDMLFQYEPEFECLYRGDLKPDIAEVAPYLVLLDRRSGFTDWIIGRGWGNHWGIFVVTRADLRVLRGHFRTFLTVHAPQGKPMLFRYYDPRVLRAYLPTCNSDELNAIFGPAICYVLEGEERNELLRLQVASGSLIEQKKHLVTQG
jgi:hypothetical protein